MRHDETNDFHTQRNAAEEESKNIRIDEEQESENGTVHKSAD